MKKRGFTLIELLAVIVVLAIVALIATPIVMNVIKNAQKGATERSAERYLSAVETAIATDRLENGQIADGTYEVNEDGNLVLGEKTLTVEVSGDRPEAGSTVTIQNGQVVSTGTNMTIGDYTVTIDSKGSATATVKEEVVVLCTATGSELSYQPGTMYTCDLGDGSRTFYVLKVTDNSVKLIMNENLGGTVAWCTSGSDNSCAADGAKVYLASQTTEWTKISQDQITLPNAQDIADAIGDAEWADDKYTGKKGPDWLKINLTGFEAPSGYWTSTVATTGVSFAWWLNYEGALGSNYVYYSDSAGVRPVITISKANMSL